MSVPRRFLQTLTTTTTTTERSPPPPSQQPLPADSSVVVILAALLCAVICVVGLGLVARCAWLRRNFSSSVNANSYLSSSSSSPNKGVKKKVLMSIPKLSFQQAVGVENGMVSSDCPICLADFEDADELRVLPQCGHGFHVECVDTWLRSHSSCPSCRSVLVKSKKEEVGTSGTCRMCGSNEVFSPETASEVSSSEVVTVLVVDDADGGQKRSEENCEGSS